MTVAHCHFKLVCDRGVLFAFRCVFEADEESVNDMRKWDHATNPVAPASAQIVLVRDRLARVSDDDH